MTNKELYGDLPKVSDKIKDLRARFAGHCYRRPAKAAAELVHWIPKHGCRNPRRPALTYIDIDTARTGGRGDQDCYARQKELEIHRDPG